MTVALNGLRVQSLRVLTPWSGPWTAEVEIPLDGLAEAPSSGPATITVEAGALVGTIDPSGSGTFAGTATLRVVGGAGGWEKIVPPKDYHSDGGLLSTAVLSTTAAEVGERLVELAPARIGTKYARAAGRASSVLAGLAWHVDAQGVTIVGPRQIVPASPELQVLSYDPSTSVVELAMTTELVSPGTVLADERFGTLKIRDVEQTFGEGGARARAWTIPVDATPHLDGLPGLRLIATLSALAREACAVAYLRSYAYRVIEQGTDGRLTLRALERDAVPTLRLVRIAFGIPGVRAKVQPGSIVHVKFLEGDPTKPVVVDFEESTPIQLEIDATLIRFNGGEANQGVARMGDAVVAGPFGGTVTAGSLTVRSG